MNPTSFSLLPAQQLALTRTLEALDSSRLVMLTGGIGRGKTAVLHQIAAERHCAFLSAADFLSRLERLHPLQMEEAFMGMVKDALAHHDLALVDDFDALYEMNYYGDVGRGGLRNVCSRALMSALQTNDKRVLLCVGEEPIGELSGRSSRVHIAEFTEEDYAALFVSLLPEATALDIPRIFRVAPNLTCYQIAQVCALLQKKGTFGTEAVVTAMQEFLLTSNVEIAHVEKVTFDDLKGMDKIIEQLMIHVVNPLQDDPRIAALQIRPKKGVLLYGPPGTGKTTVGKALAHRLGGKFFLIDGTFISRSNNFYGQLEAVLKAALDNAPSVVFVDDSDVLFEEGGSDLYRFLLTKLDGLETQGKGGLCMVMTAMEVEKLPAALLRSGRVELWLHVQPPDKEAREAILRDQFAKSPDIAAKVDIAAISAQTAKWTGADLRRIVEDGKNLLAYDLVRDQAQEELTPYFLLAIQQLKEHRDRAQKEAIGFR